MPFLHKHCFRVGTPELGTLGALRPVSRGVRWEKAEVSVRVQLK